jgi:hypothetical protein
MKPNLDPQRTFPPDREIAQTSEAIAELRRSFSDRPTGEGLALSAFGLAVLCQLDLHPAVFFPPELPVREYGRVYEEVARRFLDYVLPDDEELRLMDAANVAEYLFAIDAGRPDPGRMVAAFGLARMHAFGHDCRLTYRVGGYRGRPGNPLADHLIDSVILPAVNTLGHVPAIG